MTSQPETAKEASGALRGIRVLDFGQYIPGPLLGTGLLLSWFFTDHVFWALNENAFQANPISLVLAGGLLREALKGNGHRAGIRARIRAGVVAKIVGGVAIAGLCIQVLPGFDQVNGEVLAVLLPAHVGLAWGALRAWPPSLA